LITNEITAREDQYHCNNCGSTVEIIITPDLDWIEDVEPIKETDEENTQIIRVAARLPKPNVDD
jgi:hypothetical protein